jgi:hypothetical protein
VRQIEGGALKKMKTLLLPVAAQVLESSTAFA